MHNTIEKKGCCQDKYQEEPPPCDRPEHDAYLAAVAEGISLRMAWEIPAWAHAPGRFLPRPYFAKAPEGMRLFLLSESPLPFRRRNIFVPRDALTGTLEKSMREALVG